MTRQNARTTDDDTAATPNGCQRPHLVGPEPPSKDDIRASLQAAWDARPAHGYGLSPSSELSDAIGDAGATLSHLFDVEDLRPSELEDLDRLEGEAVQPIRDRLADEILEALVEAGVEFTRLPPDAPRAKPALERPETAATTPADAEGRSEDASTVATPTALTGAEARRLVMERIERWPRDNFTNPLADAVEQAFSSIDYTELDANGRADFETDHLSDAWGTLTGRQLKDLRTILEYSRRKARIDATWILVEAVVDAGVAFGEMHPEAPRAEPA